MSWRKMVESEMLLVKKLSPTAILPARGSKEAAGFDLSSAVDTVVPAKGKGLVKTDLAVAIPYGCYGRVAPRSGLAWKKHIDVGAGVIDSDYRGNVGVVLFNHGEEDFQVSVGDRIAQLVLERISMADLKEVEELGETNRGAGGFGSTGVSKLKEETDPSGARSVVRVVSPRRESVANLGGIALESIAKMEEDGLLTPEEKVRLKEMVLQESAGILIAAAALERTNNVAEFRENLRLILRTASP